MIERTIIPGPPGTGKTYRLVNTYLKDEVEKHKTPLKSTKTWTVLPLQTSLPWELIILYSKIILTAGESI